jgi:hypothetical protein
MVTLFAPREQLLPLLLIELTPEIARGGHGLRLTLGRLKAELQTLRAQSLARSPALRWLGLEFRIYAVPVFSNLPPGSRKRGTPNEPPGAERGSVTRRGMVGRRRAAAHRVAFREKRP